MAETVRILGVPTDYGANRRGVDMGPSALRYAGLTDAIEGTGHTCEDDGNVDIGQLPTADQPPTNPKSKFIEAVESVCRTVTQEVKQTREVGARPLVLGGDHSVAIGSIVGSAATADIGVLWFDAHGDFNTPATTPSGNVHGMALAALLGRGPFADTDWTTASGIGPENIALVGTRSLDPGERTALQESPVTVHTMSDVDQRGIRAVVNDALETVTSGTEGVHVSLDIDVLDPNVAPGVGTPERGGLTYREAHTALEMAAMREIPQSMDVVEVNPILDRHNETADLACELAASGFGERVL